MALPLRVAFAVLAVCGPVVSLASAQTVDAVPDLKSAGSSWADRPTRVLQPRKPPPGWISQVDKDHDVTWYSPAQAKKTAGPGEPPTVAYDARDGQVGFSLFCVQTNPFLDGSADSFLDSADAGMLRAYKRNGIEGIARPAARIQYLGAVGRILRIDVPGNKTTLKCDLVTTKECYTVLAVGEPGEKLNAALIAFVTSMRFNGKSQ